MNWFKKALRTVAEILLDEQGRLSVGRLILVTVFICSIILWCRGTSLPDQMFNFLLVMIGYVVTNNMQDSIKEAMEKVKSIKDIVNQAKEIIGGKSE